MGQTIKELGQGKLSEDPIFSKRFVVECCEAFHVHYRNLRILMSTNDWVSMAQGMADALKRWESRGCPEPRNGQHIELCRKDVGVNTLGGDSIKINLNKNLYALHSGKIFSEGSDLEDPKYIHLKLWDLRLELTLSDFKELAKQVKVAEESLDMVIA